jgi:glyoxylase-like metal-dependent hydrolase (beta-lactamase superfamily II)
VSSGMKLFSVIPECFKMDGGACFGVVPKSIWSKQVPSDENNLVNLTSRCLLADTGNRLVLIDTGMGDKQSEKYYTHFSPFKRVGLEKALSDIGYKTEDVTDVILTHLHFDHVGGAVKLNAQTDSFEPVFSRATYYCSAAQWETAMKPNPREKASFFPENYMILFEQGRLELLHEDGEICPGVSVEIKNGHTRGLLLPIIEYKEKKIVYTADFIATVFNLPLPYVPSFDTEPLKSMEEKEEFLDRAVENGYVLFFEHDYYHECCTLQKTPKGVRAEKTFYLSEI